MVAYRCASHERGCSSHNSRRRRHDSYSQFEFGNDIAYANNYGYYLYEDFESYSAGDNATLFIDYNATTSNVVDKFNVKNESGEKYYYVNATTQATPLISIFNATNYTEMKDYEVSGRLYIENPSSIDYGVGIMFHTEADDDSYVIYHINNSGLNGFYFNDFGDIRLYR